MPLYEYRCQACGHTFEDLRGLYERDEEVICPRCGEQRTERLLSSFSSMKERPSRSDQSSCGTGTFS